MTVDNLTLRVATPEDAQSILDIYSYYVLNTAITFECTVPSVDEFAARMRRILTKYPFYVALLQGKIVGYAYAGSFIAREAYDYSCELSIYVAYDVKRSGIGKSLYTTLFNALKAMGILNIYACIGVPCKDADEYLDFNSQQFHSHLGFKTVGTFNRCGFKFGRWYSMIWMEKLIGEHTGDHHLISFKQLTAADKN
ncbi:MAG: GNAT family N-acetyltransferase [Succinivibrio sp.]|nr:GNAT family N-acetyltransferase [Succinivibrio sp.]